MYFQDFFEFFAHKVYSPNQGHILYDDNTWQSAAQDLSEEVKTT